MKENNEELSPHDQEHENFKKETGYWGSRGVGAIIYSPEKKKFGLGLRSPDVLQPGTLGTFGGAIDGNELDREALEREISEEIGYFMPPEVFPLYTFKDEEKNFSYANYLVVIDDKYFSPDLNWENDEIVFLTLDELVQREDLHFGIQAIIKDQDALNRMIHMQKISEFKFSYEPNYQENENNSMNF